MPRLIAIMLGVAGARIGRRPRRGDHGGIAVLAAVLLAGGVMLGMGALVMDVGQIYAEREELQSGADSAALAVAEACARGGAACGGTPATLAERYASTNARDAITDIELICGSSGAGGLAACPPPPANLTACVGDPPSAATGYVEVRTRTRMTDGGTLLPPVLSGTLAGNEGYSGTEVRACARAAWGPPVRATGLGLTVSVCEWRRATADGTTFAPQPPATPPPGAEVVLYLHSTGPTAHCPAGPSGGDSPGGFGWLGSLDDNCATYIDSNGTYTADPGVSPSQGCRRKLEEVRAAAHVNLIPIFNTVTGTGVGTTYTLEGLAPFVITGYNLAGPNEPSTLTGQRYCSGSENCVYGYFTRMLFPIKGTIGGKVLGASVVTLAG